MAQPLFEPHINTLYLSAAVTITDRTGTRIQAKSPDDIVPLLSHRAYFSEVSIGLDPAHEADPFFMPATWSLFDGGLGPKSFDPPPPEEPVDYLLSYHQWQLTDEKNSSIPIGRDHPAAIGQQLADRSNTTIVMTTDLLGIPEHTFHPTTDNSSHHPVVDISEQEQPLPQMESEELTPETKAAETPVLPTTRRQARESFLNQQRHDSPAKYGWRGALSSIGIRIKPSAKEQAERDDILAVSRHWAGPRTIAVVNGKGGIGKTTDVICLSSVFATFGGGGVLAWDNNQTRGTLGWRTEQADHNNTILELLPAAGQLLSTSAQSADLAHFVHHQSADRFDVLQSKPHVLADQQRFTQTDVDVIHEVASKFYRIIIIDSGNDESDPMWRQMITHTDQLVVATTTSDESAESGALLLEDLAASSTHGEHLARNAVVLVSQANAAATRSEITSKVQGFEPLSREVIHIPHDPAMVDGHLTYGALRPATQRAWLAAGAAISRGL